MKKTILTVAIALMCMAANANLVKNYNDIITIQTEQFTDTVNAKPSLNRELVRVAFYDIDRLVITNDSCKYIRIESEAGEVILETYSDVDVDLIGGNYYVYTTSAKLVALYK